MQILPTQHEGVTQIVHSEKRTVDWQQKGFWVHIHPPRGPTPMAEPRLLSTPNKSNIGRCDHPRYAAMVAQLLVDVPGCDLYQHPWRRVWQTLCITA